MQKKGWLGNNQQFIQDFWNEYKKQFYGGDKFYSEWLYPLFFEALNSPPGRPVKYQNNDFSNETKSVLQIAPYLNGELFKEKDGIDNLDLWIPDSKIEKYFDFLFQYNFTIEENTLYDEELELNPEFLGIIFENLVVKADGAVYTPRTEVDLMCRLALVKWLQKNSSADIKDLYELFFREQGQDIDYDEHQKQGDFTTAQIRELINLLQNVTVCDPAAGSGAFEVGMMQVLNEILDSLYTRNNKPEDLAQKSPYEQKKEIIGNSLYGVEVKHWAVWINHLRLWLTLFIDMPDDYKNSQQPLLPNLNFKVRRGDSLVQRIGSKMFPVQEHANLNADLKRKITELKKLKVEFFNNKGHKTGYVRQQENLLFREILDSEINEKKRTLQGPIQQHGTQKGLFGIQDKTAQQVIQLSSTYRDKLKQEIAELEEQKRNLKDEHPLIWNIEFAEIFFDKGGFDIIIGNPPYVRQEEIADPNGNINPKDYKAALQEMVRMDFPKHFIKEMKIDGKSDLYTFFYVRSLNLLNTSGIHVFICSNSWLDVGYGVWLQYFLLKNIPVHFIIDNHARRSFIKSDINTIISVLGAPGPVRHSDPAKAGEESLIKFIAFKRPFVECILTENLLEIEKAQEILTTDAFRVYPIQRIDLLEEGALKLNDLDTGTYIGDKWGGKYLRAPDVYFKIILNSGNKIIPLGEICKVITISWSRQGRNSEIILSKLNVSKKENMVELFKSPRDVESITINIKSTKYYLKTDSKIRKQIKYAAMLWGDFKDIKHICHFCDGEIAFAHNFHGIIPYKTDDNTKVCSILNSTFTWLITEIYGRVGLGGGALRVLVEELRAKYPIINPDIVDNEKLTGAFIKIQNRKIGGVFQECGLDPYSDEPLLNQEPKPLPDRAELDKVVFDALNLTEEERKEVYRAVCQLVWNRISKAKSIKKRK
ncbi:MAG TPA: hypothetical protein ENO18_00700 [Caldithrix sp.]|nr:hypothetical protein [Caldithrix sp.]